MSPELRDAIDRARRQARVAGELLDSPTEAPRSPLSALARAALADWKASGDFERTVAVVAADDPDLATR